MTVNAIDTVLGGGKAQTHKPWLAQCNPAGLPWAFLPTSGITRCVEPARRSWGIGTDPLLRELVQNIATGALVRHSEELPRSGTERVAEPLSETDTFEDWWRRISTEQSSRSARIGTSSTSRPDAILLTALLSEVGQVTQRTPYVAVIWNLVERERLEMARRMLPSLRAHEHGETQLEVARRLLTPPRTMLTAAIDWDRSAEYDWLTQHAAEHRGEWVALLGCELVVSSRSLEEVLRAIRAVPRPVLPLLFYFGEY